MALETTFARQVQRKNFLWFPLILKKLFNLGMTLWLIATLTFLMTKAIPGDPFSDEKSLPPEIHQALRVHYGLDRPFLTQYVDYLSSIMRLDFGPSFRYPGVTVNSIIADGFPISALLGVQALIVALITGIAAGTLSAINKNQWQDVNLTIASTLGISVPSFILAALLQYLFAYKLKLVPIARFGTFTQSILPTISLALGPAALITRLVRTNMIEVLRTNYIKTAHAKGLPLSLIILRHALKNSMAPLFPFIGQITANILIGSFVIEKIYSIPGLGHWFVTSILARDYTVITGMTLFYSLILLTFLLIGDLLYLWMDPRIREEVK